MLNTMNRISAYSLLLTPYSLLPTAYSLSRLVALTILCEWERGNQNIPPNGFSFTPLDDAPIIGAFPFALKQKNYGWGAAKLQKEDIR